VTPETYRVFVQLYEGAPVQLADFNMIFGTNLTPTSVRHGLPGVSSVYEWDQTTGELTALLDTSDPDSVALWHTSAAKTHYLQSGGDFPPEQRRQLDARKLLAVTLFRSIDGDTFTAWLRATQPKRFAEWRTFVDAYGVHLALANNGRYPIMEPPW
jgi:hypothetical protein